MKFNEGDSVRIKEDAKVEHRFRGQTGNILTAERLGQGTIYVIHLDQPVTIRGIKLATVNTLWEEELEPANGTEH